MSFPAYPEYKDTEIPWIERIPSSWKLLPFFSRFFERKESNKGMKNENLLSLSYGRIVRKDIATLEGLLPASFETYQVVHPGDIVFRLTDLQNDKRSLRSAIVYEKGIITSAYLAVSAKDLNPSFSNYLFRAYDLMKVFYSMGGGLRQSMKYDDMKWLQIACPSIEEQAQIAHFLDHETAKINALIREQERLIELLQEKRQAVISHAVTKGLDPDVPMKDSGVQWLGEVPAHWEVAALKHLVIEPLKYGANEAAGDSNLDNPRFVRITDVTTEGTLREDTYRSLPPDVAAPYMLSEGDILLARSGATVGKAFIYRRAWGQCCFAGYLIKASADQEKVSPDFVYFVLQSSSYWQYIGQEQIQATIQNVSAERYGNFVLTFPTLHEQKSIIEYLQSKLDEYAGLLDVSKKTVKLLIERRSALISAAVTGKIDVRNWQPPVDESAFDEEVGQAGLETTV